MKSLGVMCVHVHDGSRSNLYTVGLDKDLEVNTVTYREPKEGIYKRAI